MTDTTKLPLPLNPIKSSPLEERRLWFDLLFHRSGPQAGQPRGYAFVTYVTVEDAEKAKKILHNAKLGSKNVIVRWAHTVSEVENDKAKPLIDIPALSGAKKEEKKISREIAIQAIEAKLKLMKECEEEFELNKPLVGNPIIRQYQKPETPKPSSSSKHYLHRHHQNRPYSRSKPRR
ncbi:Similar to rbm18: Probable RNA-binding protein 18 (Danio rerio) [Cotesia congregata]|uniref:Similar to rbm18: Probable RNA-binding protein 18 (Danio rerio) n=1 Tax=Cotesia congregata TaxID=51543 RepID=A0A8J2HRI6_COTCN|nr:Similar to rbm18: Probable RNA-binding protein 18 (Danio rerio) [Cotesia congregata]